MQSGINRAIFALLRWSGLPFLVRELAQRNRVTVLLYHTIDAPTLDAHLTLLGRLYSIRPLRECIEAMESGGVDSLPRKALVLTLDDGHAINRELKDVLAKHGVRPTIFICSGVVGTSRRFWWTVPGIGGREVEELKHVPDETRLAALAELGFFEEHEYEHATALSRSDINEMKEYVDFQSHTVLHPILPMCDADRAWHEIEASKAALEADYGLDIFALAYPNGSFSEREVAFAKKAGYDCAFTTVAGSNAAGADPFTLRRTCMCEWEGDNEVIVKAAGISGFLRRLVTGPRQ